MIWSSYLHSGGVREAEDTNRRFGSLQPSPEKKQKVSIFVFYFVSQELNLLVFLQRDNKIPKCGVCCDLPQSSPVVYYRREALQRSPTSYHKKYFNNLCLFCVWDLPLPLTLSLSHLVGNRVSSSLNIS